MTENIHQVELRPQRKHLPRFDSQAGRALLVALALISILTVGAYLRLVGLNWDENHHLHPDERFLTQVESSLNPVSSLSDYFDTPNSTLNPNNQGYGFFVYGNFPILLVQYAGNSLGMTDYGNVFLVGRALSAGADLLTIIFVFLIGRRLYDRRIGLLAAALYALAAFPIQQSHFFTVDTYTNTFVVAAFWFAVRTLDRHRWPDYALFGLALGLGVASKISVFPMAGILALAVLLRVVPRLNFSHGLSKIWADEVSRRRIIKAALGLTLGAIVALVAFRIAMPYAFLPSGNVAPGESLPTRLLQSIGMRPNPVWLDQMRQIRDLVSGRADIPPNHQWARRLPLIFPLTNIVRFGLGWPLGVVSWLAFAWAIWEIIRRREHWQRHLMVVLWAGAFFAWQGSGWVKTMRYFLPIYPFLTLIAAWALVTITDRTRTLLATHNIRRWHWSKSLTVGFLLTILIATAAWGFAFSRIYTRPVTRVAASDWIYENIPSDITLTVETEDGPRLYQIGLPHGWTPPEQLEQDEQTAPRIDFTLLNDGIPLNFHFRPNVTGTVTELRVNHVLDRYSNSSPETLKLAINAADDSQSTLMTASLTDSFSSNLDTLRGRGYDVDIEPFDIVAGTAYQFRAEASGGPLVLAGSTLANEGAWDDPLPVSREGFIPWSLQFHSLPLEMSWDDTSVKQQRMEYVLDNSDYVVITSNRFYDSLSRIPSRWPMSIAYYEALFNGDLGFELLADFTSDPNLGPLSFSDQGAEEAFTVYDHPRVLIFQKTERYSSATTAHILGKADFDNIERLRADLSNESPTKLNPPKSLNKQQKRIVNAPAPVNTRNLFNDFQPLTVVVWWLVIVALGWMAFPLLYVALPALPDRAYGLAKVVGLLLMAWIGWLMASINLVTWTRLTLLAVTIGLLLLAVSFARKLRHELWDFVRANRRHIILVEVITFAMFLAFLLVRFGNPDLWHPFYGGEKPMDFAYFNAVLNSNQFPPYDPWFAGGSINYYYFGFVLVGAPVKLLGILPSLAYNLILPTLYALTGIGAFTAAFSLVAKKTAKDKSANITTWLSYRRAVFAGGAALLMALVLGNLDQIRTTLFGLAQIAGYDPGYRLEIFPPLKDVVDGLSIKLAQGSPLPISTGNWYWNATRVIPVPLNVAGITTEPTPITEFPYFTFLYADLHAHMIAMPLSLLSITWAIAEVRRASSAAGRALRQSRVIVSSALSLLIGGLAIGALRATNTWDYPTFLVLGVGALMLGHALRRPRIGPRTLFGLLWRGALLVGLTFAFFMPFIRSYETAFTTAQLWQGSKTPIWAYLDIHGLFLFIVVSFLLWETRTWLRSISTASLARKRKWLRLIVLFAVLYMAVAFYMAFVQGYHVALLTMPLTLWAGFLFFRPQQSAEKRALFAMLMLAMALSLVVEVLVLSGDVGRMNTVFKFYLQVWLLLSVASGAALALTWPHLREWLPRLKGTWLAALGILVTLASIYPITATNAKIRDRWAPDAPNTLDGAAYIPYATRSEQGESFSLAPDYGAIQWFQNNVDGAPTILEAQTPEYRWGSRISINTGLPAVVGWNFHQRQQRSASPSSIVLSRVSDVSTLYNSTDIPLVTDLLATYDVEYIIIGDLERAYYDDAGLSKFRQMTDDGLLRIVFDEQGTTIFQVRS